MSEERIDKREVERPPSIHVTRVPQELLRQPWGNRTPLQYRKLIAGPIAVESSNTGKLFYVNANNKLSAVNWVNADNMLQCLSTGNTGGSYHVFKASASETAITDSLNSKYGKRIGLEVTAFPNPSDNTFTIIIDNLEAGAAVEMTIEDISGKTVYASGSVFADGILKLTWNASLYPRSIYFYRILVNGNKMTNGKLVKI